MSGFRKFAYLLSIGLVALGTSARAAVPPTNLGIFSPPKSQLQLVDAETEIAPIAFYKFCAKNVDQCNTKNGGQRIEMDPGSWAMLYMVNGTDKLTFAGKTRTIPGSCHADAVAATQVAMASARR